MSITIEQLATRLATEAARRGITIEELLDDLDSKLDSAARRKLGFVSLGASVSGRDSTDIDAMLAEGFGRPAAC